MQRGNLVIYSLRSRAKLSQVLLCIGVLKGGHVISLKNRFFLHNIRFILWPVEIYAQGWTKHLTLNKLTARISSVLDALTM